MGEYLTAALTAIALLTFGISPAYATTLGGLTTAGLGSADAVTRLLTGVQLEWDARPVGSDWMLSGLALTPDPGQSFAAGDTVRVALEADIDSDPVCEFVIPVSEEQAAAGAVRVDEGVVGDECPAFPLGEATTVAVAVTGTGVATTLTSRVGPVSGTLASYSGTVLDTGRTLQAGFDTEQVSGQSYVSELFVDVTSGATAGELIGQEVSVALYDTDADVAYQFTGTISDDSDAPVRVTTTRSATGASFPTILIDPRQGDDPAGWPREDTVARFSVMLSSPQHLGTPYDGAAPDQALSIVDGTIDADDPGTRVPSSALDPIGLDQRLVYAYPKDKTNDTNQLSFCHTFTLVNTSDEPVAWSLTFDTSLPPMWGLDPTKPGAFSSAWNFVTTSYDATTHLWTIAGVAGNNDVLAPGQSLGAVGYCVQNVPVPPVDPDSFDVQVEVEPGSTEWWVALRITVTSTSQWSVPWEATVDLADYVCPTNLAGRSVTFQRSVATPVAGSSTAYLIRGTTGDTRFVSASLPRDYVFVAYSPGGTKWQKSCG
ncbi:hypothetical protein GCM10009785_09070 [Brooklawnia cerclae]